MFCPKCGVENPDDRELCVSCSWVLGSTTSQPAVNAKTSGLAVAALVLGIMSMFTLLLTTLPAIICGIIAVVKINKSRGQLKGMGLAIAGMALPAVAIPVVAMLLAIMMPALSKTKHMAQRIVCATNLKGLSIATMTYSLDYDNEFPTGNKWCDLLIDEADVSPMSLNCPVEREVPFGYGFNSNLEGRSFDDVDADVVMMFEIEGGKNITGGPELLYTLRHDGEGCNIAFVDGHVEFIRTENLESLKWVPTELIEDSEAVIETTY